MWRHIPENRFAPSKLLLHKDKSFLPLSVGMGLEWKLDYRESNDTTIGVEESDPGLNGLLS